MVDKRLGAVQSKRRCAVIVGRPKRRGAKWGAQGGRTVCYRCPGIAQDRGTVESQGSVSMVVMTTVRIRRGDADSVTV